jgi:hypothetical protein
MARIPERRFEWPLMNLLAKPGQWGDIAEEARHKAALAGDIAC